MSICCSLLSQHVCVSLMHVYLHGGSMYLPNTIANSTTTIIITLRHAVLVCVYTLHRSFSRSMATYAHFEYRTSIRATAVNPPHGPQCPALACTYTTYNSILLNSRVSHCCRNISLFDCCENCGECARNIIRIFFSILFLKRDCPFRFFSLRR